MALAPPQAEWVLTIDEMVAIHWLDDTVLRPCWIKHLPTLAEPYWVVVDEHGNPFYFTNMKYIRRCHPRWHTVAS
jgi:hypothetical protein